MRNLYFGCQGEDVKKLQERLESLGYADFQPTTFFGIKTHLAVRKYQNDNNLPQTGIFGTTEASMMGIKDKKSRGEQLFDVAMTYTGKDVTPKDEVPDDVACAETVDTLYYKTFGEYISGGISVSTTVLKNEMLFTSSKFQRVPSFEKYAILVYPTGEGNGRLANGHIFICGDSGKLYSNTSATGKFEQNYNLFTAKYRYETIGGFKPFYFRLI